MHLCWCRVRAQVPTVPSVRLAPIFTSHQLSSTKAQANRQSKINLTKSQVSQTKKELGSGLKEVTANTGPAALARSPTHPANNFMDITLIHY